MSKLALLRESGMVGDPFFGIIGRTLARGVRGIAGLVRRRPGAIAAATGATAAIIPAAGRVLARRGVQIAGAAAGGAALGGLLGGRGEMGFRRRRAKGITSRELRGFRKVTNLLRKVGMVPKGLGRRSRKVC